MMDANKRPRGKPRGFLRFEYRGEDDRLDIFRDSMPDRKHWPDYHEAE
jgi:hypothetical protein